MNWRFYLTYNGNQTEIDPPKAFKDFESEIKRDFRSHGLFYMFTSDTLKLEFAGGGKEILHDALITFGIDATVTLQVDQRNDEDSPWETVFTGNAVFENFEEGIDYFKVDFENDTFITRITNNFDKRINVEQSTDLEGNALSGSLSEQTSTFFDEQFVADFRDPADSGSNDSYTTGALADPTEIYTYYFVPDFELVVTNELTQNRTTGASQTNPTALTQSEPADTWNFFDIERTGDVLFAPVLKYQMQFNDVAGTSGSTNPSIHSYYTWVLKHYRANGALVTTYDKDTSGLSNWGESSVSPITAVNPSTGDQDFGLQTRTLTPLTISNVLADDQFVFYIKMEIEDQDMVPEPIEATINLDVYHNSRISLGLVFQNIKSYLIFDILERLTYIITGVQGGFWSDFFALTAHGSASNGCGGLISITNGAQLRGIDNPVNTSLKELLTSLQSMYGIGWSIEDTYSGTDYRLRVELMEYYYSDGEVLNLGSVDDYFESAFDALMINEVEVGYKEFSKDENLPSSREEIHDMWVYSLPNIKVKNKLSLVSGLIASTQLFRAAFVERADLTKSWKYDDKNYITLLKSDYSPEADGNFDSVAGITDTTTAYNLRITPVYMLLNNSLLINSALYKKGLTSSLIISSQPINSSYTAEMTSSYECLLKDSQHLLRDTGNILIEEMNYGLRLFNPLKHVFQKGLSKENLDLIVDAMQNKLYSDNRNFGYLSYTDEDGNTKQGYLLRVKWNPVTKIAKFETLERADNYV